MRLADATRQAVKTVCYYVPEDQQDIRLALATFDAIAQAFEKGEVKTFAELRSRLGVEDPPPVKDTELGELF